MLKSNNNKKQNQQGMKLDKVPKRSLGNCRKCRERDREREKEREGRRDKGRKFGKSFVLRLSQKVCEGLCFMAKRDFGYERALSLSLSSPLSLPLSLAASVKSFLFISFN